MLVPHDNGRIPCRGDIQAAHVQNDDRVPYDERGGTSIKAGDNWTYPQCDAHHKQSHRGHAAFDELYGIDRVEIAADLWKISPHRFKWERKMEQT